MLKRAALYILVLLTSDDRMSKMLMESISDPPEASSLSCHVMCWCERGRVGLVLMVVG